MLLKSSMLRLATWSWCFVFSSSSSLHFTSSCEKENISRIPLSTKGLNHKCNWFNVAKDSRWHDLMECTNHFCRLYSAIPRFDFYFPVTVTLDIAHRLRCDIASLSEWNVMFGEHKRRLEIWKICRSIDCAVHFSCVLCVVCYLLQISQN